MKYIASCSFGKDSLAMLKIIKDNPQKYPLDEVVFCKVMASPTMSGNFPIQDEFIDKMIPIIEAKVSVPIKVITAKISFEEQFYKKKTKGNHIGTIYGFPMTLKAWCNDRLKVKPLDEYYKSQGEHIRYIGIAYDEPKRHERLEQNEIALLFEEKITEEMAMQICIENDMRSPIYDYFKRDGCWFCPKQNLESLNTIYQKFPQLWSQLKDWQKHSPIPFKPNKTIFDLGARFMKAVQNND